MVQQVLESFPQLESLNYLLIGDGVGAILFSILFLSIFSLMVLLRHTTLGTPKARGVIMAITIPLAFIFLLNIASIIVHKM